MKYRTKRPDLEAVLKSLKDFQRRTVDYAFKRLFLDKKGTRRFLVADEVGLGKTLVARGVVARAIDHLWEKSKRIDVIYICSNASIAQQNINRLNVTGEENFEIASRITLLPVTIKNLKHRKLNFVSFTPGTSFDLKSSMGHKKERALIHWLLDRAWGLKGTPPLNVLQGTADAENFRWLVDSFEQNHEIDESLAKEFARSLKLHGKALRKEGKPDLRMRFKQLCKRFKRLRKSLPHELSRERRELVGELRALLASTCLEALEPDLVILDEFQRFRDLLDATDEAGKLAQGFFEHPEVRILLLSATPYKPLTLQQDRENGEDHHTDFIRTIRFLQNDGDQTQELQSLLSEHGRELYRLRSRDNQVRSLCERIRQVLSGVMARTERLAVSEDRNGMLKVVPCDHLRFKAKEAVTYAVLQKLAHLMSSGDTIEYWKSAPYLLNFMDRYELKYDFERALGTVKREAIRKILKHSDGLLLSPAEVKAYGKIDPCNTRLDYIMGETLDAGAWKLLWVPPSMPYYRLGPPFSDPALAGFTKRLVFSSWRVVPRAVSSLVSYEAERRIFTAFERGPKNTTAARERHKPLLRFARSNKRLTGMPVLGLFYPSMALASEFDPCDFAGRNISGNGSALPPSNTLIERIRRKLDSKLAGIGAYSVKRGQPDDAWYWAAPILLDLRFKPGAVKSWFQQDQLAAIWSGEVTGEASGITETRWADHVEEARRLVCGQFRQLGRAPKELSLVLAQMAVAGPAVCALRALTRACGSIEEMNHFSAGRALRNGAAQIAWAFGHVFNRKESMALLRAFNGQEPYWRRVLEYCIEGCLQALLDEYIHMLRESLGLLDIPPGKAIEQIASEVCSAATLTTASLSVDYIKATNGRVQTGAEGPGMRSHFAVRFGEERAEEDQGLVRAGQIRSAFNSPFWPFVLTTTSVGQEGLDFHTYCHAVVHWNLPSNPVDLEQREGRVHRYKGHAVRKNLVLKYGRAALKHSASDPWEQLFQMAKVRRKPGATDLVPFWVFETPGGAKIERHVPMLPLSRDQNRMEELRRSLAVYRAVFGQMRQEDLISFLLSEFTSKEIGKISQDLRIDLSPPQDGRGYKCS
jgi:hypothetical protein